MQRREKTFRKPEGFEKSLYGQLQSNCCGVCRPISRILSGPIIYLALPSPEESSDLPTEIGRAALNVHKEHTPVYLVFQHAGFTLNDSHLPLP